MTEQTTVENWVDQAKAVENGKAPSGSVSIKLTGENSVTSPGQNEAPKGESYKTQHAKVLRVEVSIGKEYGEDERTIEEFEAAVKEALFHNPEVGAHNVCTQGAYYIIDGKVCMPKDYDPATKNRKPGTFPPMWAGGPDPKKQQPFTAADVTDDTDDDSEREFVRIQSTKPRRDPVTGVKPRKPRSDKGMKKGPRKTTEDKEKATDAIERMRSEGLNQ